MPRENIWFEDGNTPVPGLFSCCRARRQEAQEPMDVHRHGPDHFEIVYLAEGRRTYFVDGNPCVLRGHEVLVVRPGETHDTRGMAQEKCMFYAVVLRIAREPGSFLCLRGDAADVLRDALLQIRSTSFHGDPTMIRDLDDLLQACASPPSDRLRSARACSSLLSFLLAVIRCAGKQGRQAPDPWVEQAIRHIDAHIGTPLRLGDMAAAMDMSESRLKHRFREEFGMSPHDYVLRRKVDLARERLQSGSTRITDVAMELGFSSSQHFARVFRQYTGMSPSEFRRTTRTK